MCETAGEADAADAATCDFGGSEGNTKVNAEAIVKTRAVCGNLQRAFAVGAGRGRAGGLRATGGARPGGPGADR